MAGVRLLAERSTIFEVITICFVIEVSSCASIWSTITHEPFPVYHDLLSMVSFMTEDMLYTASEMGPIVKYDLQTDTLVGSYDIHEVDYIYDMAIYDNLLFYVIWKGGLRAIHIADGQPIALDVQGLNCDLYLGIHVMDGT